VETISRTVGNDKEIVKSFTGIPASKTLKIKINPKKGNTILSGIELIQESLPKN
jgi:hypothetical protein